MVNLPCKLEKQINNLSVYGKQGQQFGIQDIFLSNCGGTLDDTSNTLHFIAEFEELGITRHAHCDVVNYMIYDSNFRVSAFDRELL